MNLIYARAKTPEERIAVAVAAANRQFAKLRGAEAIPDRAFYSEFLEPFLQRELRQAQLDELHLVTTGAVRKRERQIIDALQHWNKRCEEILKP